MKKHGSGKEPHGLILCLLLKVDLCLPGETISFVKQMFPESDCQLCLGSASALGPDQRLLLRMGKAIGSTGFTFHWVFLFSRDIKMFCLGCQEGLGHPSWPPKYEALTHLSLSIS